MPPLGILLSSLRQLICKWSSFKWDSRLQWKLSIKLWHILYLWGPKTLMTPLSYKSLRLLLLQIRASGTGRQPPTKGILRVLELSILWHGYEVCSLWQERIGLLLGSCSNWCPMKTLELSSLIMPFGRVATAFMTRKVRCAQSISLLNKNSITKKAAGLLHWCEKVGALLLCWPKKATRWMGSDSLRA